MPPTETKGRTHTSTVIVTVIDLDKFKNRYVVKDSDIKKIITRGYGAGGQHKNKVETCVILKHLPTGIQCRIDGRSQFQNNKLCKQILISRINDHFDKILKTKKSLENKKQSGNGERSEYRRIYNYKSNIIKDILTNKKISLKEFFKGNISKLQ